MSTLDFTSTVTLSDLQKSNFTSFFWGCTVFWQTRVVIDALRLYHRKRKSRSWVIYVMNALQAISMLIKTLSAAIYAIILGLDCDARAWMMNVFLVVAVEAIYGLLLVKLLLFTPFRRAAQVFFGIAVSVHFLLVLSGTIMSTDSINLTTGLCGNKYPILYKQQYTIEAIIEAVTFGLLIHGLTQQSSDAFAIFEQLRNNEHLRVFAAMIFITLKIIFTYTPITSFDASVLTHSVDTARSALVCWALNREDHKVTAALEKSMSTDPSRRLGPKGPQPDITESHIEKSVGWNITGGQRRQRNGNMDAVKSRYDTEDWEGFEAGASIVIAEESPPAKRKEGAGVPDSRWTLTIDETIEEKSSAEQSSRS
ncbi:hypothetical protein SmJEL517_g04050 [Synchytrium microbalum]|uniref:Uncharacterized protein n=1 Tax=Synchytrium microbalum TaxID=1806994 RepID=A0A507C1D2_9FUNG|nr:uncharacterized protein SmJEL517_g04050 [Synchytrium microbalum]TPX32869.1 hypothetical protein SmJEL517_g04050 [Synchytrium microbalum]